ncbi:MAG: DNA polymerase III subunit chi [Sphingomonadaceae bacterium]|nr:DNA polymerase III subunit chi [Sphingomonadaceae bacterium]
MRIGFYLLQRDPVERALPQIAAKAMQVGQKMLVVSGDGALLDRLDKALWTERPDDFLAHGKAGDGKEDRQPILLSQSCDAQNGAILCALADGQWRDEALQFERVFLFFEDSQRATAREVWRKFDASGDVEREFYEQHDGKWRKVA